MKKETQSIILTGMPTSGKSTAGVILAKILGMDFVDTDLLIQKREGQTLSEIIAGRSIDGFLAVEEAVCLSLSAEADHGYVIATGGSVVYSQSAMQHFKRMGKVVYLKIDLPTLQKRLHDARQRGVILKDGQSIADLYHERTPLYERYADLVVSETGLDLEQTVEAILNALS